MEKPSRSHDLGIMTDARNHNTSKNSLGNQLQHSVLSHGGKSASIFHTGRIITSEFMLNLQNHFWSFRLMTPTLNGGEAGNRGC